MKCIPPFLIIPKDRGDLTAIDLGANKSKRPVPGTVSVFCQGIFQAHIWELTWLVRAEKNVAMAERGIACVTRSTATTRILFFLFLSSLVFFLPVDFLLATPADRLHNWRVTTKGAEYGRCINKAPSYCFLFWSLPTTPDLASLSLSYCPIDGIPTPLSCSSYSRNPYCPLFLDQPGK